MTTMHGKYSNFLNDTFYRIKNINYNHYSNVYFSSLPTLFIKNLKPKSKFLECCLLLLPFFYKPVKNHEVSTQVCAKFYHFFQTS